MTVGWMDGWLDGWMDGWVDGWMDGWACACVLEGRLGFFDLRGRGHGCGEEMAQSSGEEVIDMFQIYVYV